MGELADQIANEIVSEFLSNRREKSFEQNIKAESIYSDSSSSFINFCESIAAS